VRRSQKNGMLFFIRNVFYTWKYDRLFPSVKNILNKENILCQACQICGPHVVCEPTWYDNWNDCNIRLVQPLTQFYLFNGNIVNVTTAWHVRPHIFLISGCGQLMGGGCPALGLGRRPTSPHHTQPTCYITSMWIFKRGEDANQIQFTLHKDQW
jgi:hypothetical protein